MLKKIISTLVLSLMLLSILNSKVFADGVEYKGRPDGLVINGNNSFFGNVLPGDEKNWEFELINSSKNDVELFFKIYVPEQSKEIIEKDLAEKLQIKVIHDYNGNKKTLYDGVLNNLNEMQDYTSLGMFKGLSNAKLIFIIKLPTDVTNEYASLYTNVEWQFMIIDEEKNIETTEDNKNENKPDENGQSEQNGQNSSNEQISQDGENSSNGQKGLNGKNAFSIFNPKTGDAIIIAVTILIIAIVLLVLVIIKRKNNSREKKGNDKNKK